VDSRVDAGSEPLEVEWQFDAADLDAVDRWLRSEPARANVVVVPEGEKLQFEDYLDSEDWRVLRAGYTLRIRRSGGEAEATLKAFSTSDGLPRRRIELNQRLAAGATDPTQGSGLVTDRLKLLLAARALRRLFSIETRRRTFSIDQDGSALALLTLDGASVRGSGAPYVFHRVEVEECVAGGLDRIAPFMEALRTNNDLRPSTQSKFQVGLLAAGMKPPVTGDLRPLEVPENAIVSPPTELA
jgi:inorganic triphosphatase YgiF